MFFCYRVTVNTTSFLKLIINTKRSKWPHKNPSPIDVDNASAYLFQFNKQQQPFYLRTYAGDLQIFYDIFWRSIYQFPDPLFKRAKTIVDLGGHIGFTAAWLHWHCPNAKVYTVEADESNYALLTKNLQPQLANGVIIADHAAISNSNGTVYLQRSKHSYNSQLSGMVTNFPVPGIRLQQFLQQHRLTHIDLIKIDIEGAEFFLFTDDTEWLTITDTIIVEIHSEENLQLFTKAVTPYGFIIEEKNLEHESLYVAYKHYQ
ncbi:FkbM family methyltransferase [Niastella populi]|uniref:FkbM family methyltransferase n=1 Tax=Niastella populi TaxID=550983 RepID=UPI0013FDDDB7|nr:FkbM family methyltransferase [Niastella populi]